MPIYQFTLEDIQQAAEREAIIISTHALRRMRERNVNSEQIVSVLLQGEIVSRDQFDVPHPSCKMSVTLNDTDVLQVVVAYDSSFREVQIITLYWKR